MSASKQQSGPPIERKLVDGSGATWRVTEMRVWDAAGRSRNSLVAEHECGFRRLWDFPANWMELGDLELAELVSRPSGRRARPKEAE